MKTLLKQGLAVGACAFLALLSAKEVSADNIYRLYNPHNHEHLYTRDYNEYDTLYKKHGWGQEGTAWVSPASGTPVYRLYNAGLQNHLYTSDLNEINTLTSRYGWVKDNSGQPVFYSGGSVAIYRVYNAGLRGLHHWTTDANEYNTLPAQGWQQEGVKFNAVSLGKPQVTIYAQAQPSYDETRQKQLQEDAAALQWALNGGGLEDQPGWEHLKDLPKSAIYGNVLNP